MKKNRRDAEGAEKGGRDPRLRRASWARQASPSAIFDVGEFVAKAAASRRTPQ